MAGRTCWRAAYDVLAFGGWSYVVDSSHHRPPSPTLPLHFRIAPPQRFLVGMEEFYIKAVTSDGVQIVREPEPAPSGPFIDEDNGEEIAVDHA